MTYGKLTKFIYHEIKYVNGDCKYVLGASYVRSHKVVAQPPTNKYGLLLHMLLSRWEENAKPRCIISDHDSEWLS